MKPEPSSGPAIAPFLGLEEERNGDKETHTAAETLPSLEGGDDPAALSPTAQVFLAPSAGLGQALKPSLEVDHHGLSQSALVQIHSYPNRQPGRHAHEVRVEEEAQYRQDTEIEKQAAAELEASMAENKALLEVFGGRLAEVERKVAEMGMEENRGGRENDDANLLAASESAAAAASTSDAAGPREDEDRGRDNKGRTDLPASLPSYVLLGLCVVVLLMGVGNRKI